MSVITKLKIKSEFSKLENNIKKLKSSRELLDFQMIISNSIKLLSSILQSTRNKNNLYGKKISTELLINIVSFLSCDYNSICKSICKTWKETLESKLSKKILPLIPKNMNMFCFGSLELDFIPKVMIRVKDEIYISNNSSVCKINTERSRSSRVNNKKFVTDMMN